MRWMRKTPEMTEASTGQSAGNRPHPLAVELFERLRGRGLTLVAAESCTGGLVGDLITDVPGSSAYFLGSAGTYSNEAKMRLLGVRAETLVAHGAVSAETAAEMAAGARRLYGADIAVSVTGIAGPTGGSAEKPVGLCYIHMSAREYERGARFVWGADRVGNKRLSAEAALQMVLDWLENAPAASPHPGMDNPA
jgi:PncC family amidohydrolase